MKYPKKGCFVLGTGCTCTTIGKKLQKGKLFDRNCRRKTIQRFREQDRIL